jgi:GTP-binding protein
MSLKVAIVGRPNVGKSTLFNRLIGKKLALVDATPGVTRDRREGEAHLGDLTFTVIDTAGLEEKIVGDSLAARMRRQTELAISNADVCLLLIDGRAGITPLDKYFAKIIRKSITATILVANKCEHNFAETGRIETYELGFGIAITLSAEHGYGLSLLYQSLRPYADAIIDNKLEKDKTDPNLNALYDKSNLVTPLRIAIVGRPNVGKSTLVNTLIGKERMITGPEAGITRDAIGIEWIWHGRHIKLWDTAGIRRRSRVTVKLDKLSIADTLRAIRFAEVVVVILDASIAFERQDLHIADLVEQEGRALVIVVNKWDTVKAPKEQLRDLEEKLERLLPQIRGLPIITMSALTGSGTEHLLLAIEKIHVLWNVRISTAKLNRGLEVAIKRHLPPIVGGRPIKLKYISQIKARPPTFVVFSSRAGEVPTSYCRYLVNGLREAFDLPSVPIRLFMRAGNNPFMIQKKHAKK